MNIRWEILRSKPFRIAILILIITMPFIISWILVGFVWAITIFTLVAILAILILGYLRKKKREYEYENTDEELYIVERKQKP